MSLNKKRKLDAPSASLHLSAFAARKVLATSSPRESKSQDGQIHLKDEQAETNSASFVLPHSGTQAGYGMSSLQVMSEESGSNRTFIDHDQTMQQSSSESPAEAPEIPVEQPSITLSSFKPSKDTVRTLGDESLSIRLAPGERLVIIGQFEISVQKGQIAIMGSILRPSKRYYRVFAPSSHSLPVIRCSVTDTETAELRLRPFEAGLRSLELLSPLFGKLWNEGSSPLGPEYTNLVQKSKGATFQVLFSSDDGYPKAYLQFLISPPEWNEMLSKCTTISGRNPRAIMVCGPKSSGKSTFAKFLVNRLVSNSMDPSQTKQRIKTAGIAFLDLDPGQPEYSPPGQLSLVYVLEPNFGPSFTHPIPNAKCKVIRSHTIAALSPSLDPSLYMACVSDLFAHYRSLLSTESNCPLVINTPGWVLGTGLEILVELISQIRPSDIIYMSQDGPVEVVDSLREAAHSTVIMTLPSQASEFTTRTAAHLRTMQSMSYFHQDLPNKAGLSWNSLPLTSLPPWEIRYSGENPGLLGVMCYGEQPPPNLLAESINGSLVAVVVIDDMAAISGWASESEETESTKQSHEECMKADDRETRVFNQDFPQPHNLERPLIIRTPDEGLPYFNPSNSISLDPTYSHSLGLALVRGIDVARRQLQVLTPITASVIEDITQAGKSIVLVNGKLDTPGWAYIEGLTQKNSSEKATRKELPGTKDNVYEESSELEGSEDRDVSEQRIPGDGFQNAPWVEKLEGSQGRGVGARVWRVRRDLGRSSDGGD